MLWSPLSIEVDFHAAEEGLQNVSIQHLVLTQDQSGWVGAEVWFSFTPSPLRLSGLGILKNERCKCLKF